MKSQKDRMLKQQAVALSSQLLRTSQGDAKDTESEADYNETAETTPLHVFVNLGS